MKKNLIFLLMVVLWALCPVVGSAEGTQGNQVMENVAEKAIGEFLGNGYTEDGIYYEVYGETVILRSSEYVTVNRKVIYEGMVQPRSTLYWEEQINGEYYAGTLSLLNYYIDSNETIAVYTGKLYKK